MNLARKFLLTGILLCASMSAYAATNTFSGWSVGADAGGSVDLSDVKANYNYVNLFGSAADASTVASQRSDGDGGAFISDVYVDYNHAINEKWFLGVDSTVFFEGSKEAKSATYSFANPNNRADFPRSYSVDTEIDPLAHLSFGVKPGYAFTDKLLGYASVSYHYMRADVSSRTSIDRSNLNAAAVVTDVSTKRNFNGIGVGGGVRYQLSQNWFLNISAEWLYFGKRNVPGPSLISAPDEITLTQTQEIQPSWVDIKAGLSYRF